MTPFDQDDDADWRTHDPYGGDVPRWCGAAWMAPVGAVVLIVVGLILWIRS